jgi:CHAD domain-containing protein
MHNACDAMTYRFKRKESVEEGIRRIATEQIDRALYEIDDDALDRHETVHQLRKRCKKLRALARLVRPAFPDYGRVNAIFRDAARELSYLRDAHVVVETFDHLIERFEATVDAEAFRGVRDKLAEHRDTHGSDGEGIESPIARFRDTMVATRTEIADWTLRTDGGRVVAAGASMTYKRARKAMGMAEDTPSTAVFHEWRKRMKYHWYHARLLKGCWPGLLKPWAREAGRMSDLLGDEHDLAVLHALLLTDPDRFADKDALQALTALIGRRRAELRARALQLGRFLLFDRPKRLEARVRAYFDAWQSPIKALEVPAPRDTED